VPLKPVNGNATETGRTRHTSHLPPATSKGSKGPKGNGANTRVETSTAPHVHSIPPSTTVRPTPSDALFLMTPTSSAKRSPNGVLLAVTGFVVTMPRPKLRWLASISYFVGSYGMRRERRQPTSRHGQRSPYRLQRLAWTLYKTASYVCPWSVLWCGRRAPLQHAPPRTSPKLRCALQPEKPQPTSGHHMLTSCRCIQLTTGER